MIWQSRFTPGRICFALLVVVVLWVMWRPALVPFACTFVVSAVFHGLDVTKRKSGTAGTPIIDPRMEELLVALGSDDVNVREHTVSRMRADSVAVVEDLQGSLRIAQEQAGLQRRGLRARQVGGIVFVAAVLAAILASGAPMWTAAAMSGAFGCIFVVQILAVRRLPLEQQALIYALSCLDNPSSCGYLIDGAIFGRNGVRRSSRDALKRILPSITLGEAQLVPLAKKSALYMQLLTSDAAFVSAILAAIPAFDESGFTLHSVKRLASGDGAVGNDPDIRASAAALIPLLSARSEELTSATTLLRAGRPSADDSYLRPVQSKNGSESIHMVRAAGPTDVGDG